MWSTPLTQRVGKEKEKQRLAVQLLTELWISSLQRNWTERLGLYISDLFSFSHTQLPNLYIADHWSAGYSWLKRDSNKL